MKVKIYQIEMEKDIENAKFRSLDEHKKVYGKVDEKLYKKVFDGDLKLRGNEEGALALERVYEALNIGEKPEGYTGTSLSVSDIVVLENGEAYYVEPFGYAKLDSFKPEEPAPRKARALPVDVLRTKYKGSSNGGISEKYDRLLVLCKDGFEEVDLNNPPENLVVVVKRNMFGKCSDYIEPYASLKKGCVGWMFGGSYAESSDSRFSEMVGFYGAVAIHDRQETQEQYDLLSR